MLSFYFVGWLKDIRKLGGFTWENDDGHDLRSKCCSKGRPLSWIAAILNRHKRGIYISCFMLWLVIIVQACDPQVAVHTTKKICILTNISFRALYGYCVFSLNRPQMGSRNRISRVASLFLLVPHHYVHSLQVKQETWLKVCQPEIIERDSSLVFSVY